MALNDPYESLPYRIGERIRNYGPTVATLPLSTLDPRNYAAWGRTLNKTGTAFGNWFNTRIGLPVVAGLTGQPFPAETFPLNAGRVPNSDKLIGKSIYPPKPINSPSGIINSVAKKMNAPTITLTPTPTKFVNEGNNVVGTDEKGNVINYKPYTPDNSNSFVASRTPQTFSGPGGEFDAGVPGSVASRQAERYARFGVAGTITPSEENDMPWAQRAIAVQRQLLLNAPQ